jgi:hypothetical protein
MTVLVLRIARSLFRRYLIKSVDDEYNPHKRRPIFEQAAQPSS